MRPTLTKHIANKKLETAYYILAADHPNILRLQSRPEGFQKKMSD